MTREKEKVHPFPQKFQLHLVDHTLPVNHLVQGSSLGTGEEAISVGGRSLEKVGCPFKDE